MSEHTPSLKPCPFCGGEARLYSGEDDFAVEHNGCDACFDAVFNDAASAITAWNTRASHAALKAALEDLYAMVQGEAPRLLEDWHGTEEVRRALSEA